MKMMKKGKKARGHVVKQPKHKKATKRSYAWLM
jgi:hypothetical protein